MSAPTQAEIEALSRELTEGPDPCQKVGLHRRAAIMIARLELAWLEGLSHDRP
jgi:hypothetical protein